VNPLLLGQWPICQHNLSLQKIDTKQITNEKKKIQNWAHRVSRDARNPKSIVSHELHAAASLPSTAVCFLSLCFGRLFPPATNQSMSANTLHQALVKSIAYDFIFSPLLSISLEKGQCDAGCSSSQVGSAAVCLHISATTASISPPRLLNVAHSIHAMPLLRGSMTQA
jgi:hypothetical protein